MSKRVRRRIILIAVLLLALVGVGVGGYFLREHQRARTLASNLQTGLKAYEAGDYRAAIRPLSDYVKRGPKRPDVMLKLAQARRRVPVENNSHIAVAVRYAEAARDADPTAMEPKELLLELYLQAGQLTELRDEADRILISDPSHRAALQARADSLRLIGRREEALQAALQYAGVHPDDMQAHRMVIGTMQLLEKPAEEIVAYTQQIVERLPESGPAAVLRGLAALAARDAQGAREFARRAASKPFSSTDEIRALLFLLDQVPDATGEMAKLAGDAINRGIADPALAEPIAALAAERFWKLGQVTEARSVLGAAIADPAKAGSDVLGWAGLLLGQSEQGAGPGALAALKSRTDPKSSCWALVIQSAALLEKGQAAEARKLLSDAAAKDPQNPTLVFIQAAVEQSLGEIRSAELRLQELAGRPEWRIARSSLANLLMSTGRYADVVAVCSTDAGLLSSREGAQMAAGAAVSLIEVPGAKPEDRDRVLKLLERLADGIPDEPLFRSYLARAYVAVGRIQDARAAAELVLANPPAAPELLRLADALASHDGTLAASMRDRATATGSSEPAVIFALARRSAEAGDVAGGRARLQQLIDSSSGPDQVRARLLLGAYLDEVGDPEARTMLQGLAESNPGDIEAQRIFLDAQSTWTSDAGIAQATERLKSLTGSAAVMWRVCEARRLLTFDSDEAAQAKALRLLAEARNSNPGNPAVLTWLAEALVRGGDRVRAIQALAEAVSVGKLGLGCYPRLVQLLQEEGRNDEAEFHLLGFCSYSEVTLAVRRQRAALLLRQAMWEEAIADLKVLGAAGDTIARVDLAKVYRSLGRAEESQAVFEQALAEPRPAKEAVIAAADFTAAKGDMEAALTYFDRLPEDVTAEERSTLRAQLLEQYGQADLAEKELVRSNQSGGEKAADALARFYIRQQRYAEADSILAKAMSDFPASNELKTTRSLLTLQTNQEPGAAAKAMGDLASSLKSQDVPREMLQLVDAMTHSVNNPEDVNGFRERLKAITKASPTYMPAWRLLVRSYLDSGDLRLAISSAREAMRVAPSDPAGAELTTIALEAAGQTNDMLLAASAWRERAPTSLDARLALGRAMVLTDRPAQALELLEPVVRRFTPATANGLTHAIVATYGQALVDLGRSPEAYDLLAPFIATSPEFRRGAWFTIVAYSIKEPAQVRAWMEEAERLSDPESAPDAEALGKAWGIIAGRVPEMAEEALSKAQSIADKLLARSDKGGVAAVVLMADVHQTRSRIQRAAGRTAEAAASSEQAISFYLKAADLVPDQSEYLAAAAQAAELAGDFKRAAQLFEQLLEKHKPTGIGAAAVKNNIAFLWFSANAQGPDLERAAALSKEAVDAAPEAAFLDTLGWIELARDNPRDAVLAFRKALQLDNQMPTAHLGIVAALAAGSENEKAEARQWVDRADASLRAAGAAISDRITQRYLLAKAAIADAGDK